MQAHVHVRTRACLSRDFQNALKSKVHKSHTHRVRVTLTTVQVFLIFLYAVSNPRGRSAVDDGRG